MRVKHDILVKKYKFNTNRVIVNENEAIVLGKVIMKDSNIVKLFPERSVSENLSIFNSCISNLTNRGIDALTDISVALSENDETVENIKKLVNQIIKLKKSYIKFLENLKGCGVQTRLVQVEFCDLCGKKIKESKIFNGFRYCERCYNLAKVYNINDKILSNVQRIRSHVKGKEYDFLKMFKCCDEITIEIHKLNYHSELELLENKGVIEINRKVYPQKISLTELGKKIREVLFSLEEA